MVANAYGPVDKVSKDGDTMTGTLTVAASPPLAVPVANPGYVLTCDEDGNLTLQPGGGGSGVTIDTAAGDLQPLGAAAAGVSGVEVAAAKHVHPSSSTTAFTSAVVNLAYAATINVNAAAGNHFRVTLTGGATLANPTNGVDGQKITVEVIQDATGSRTLGYGTGYAFGVTVPEPTLTTTPGKRDFLAFIYNQTTGLWYCTGVAQGY